MGNCLIELMPLLGLGDIGSSQHLAMLREKLYFFQAGIKVEFLLEVERCQVRVPRMNAKHSVFSVQLRFMHTGTIAMHVIPARTVFLTCLKAV